MKIKREWNDFFFVIVFALPCHFQSTEKEWKKTENWVPLCRRCSILSLFPVCDFIIGIHIFVLAWVARAISDHCDSSPVNPHKNDFFYQPCVVSVYRLIQTTFFLSFDARHNTHRAHNLIICNGLSYFCFGYNFVRVVHRLLFSLIFCSLFPGNNKMRCISILSSSCLPQCICLARWWKAWTRSSSSSNKPSIHIDVYLSYGLLKTIPTDNKE